MITNMNNISIDTVTVLAIAIIITVAAIQAFFALRARRLIVSAIPALSFVFCAAALFVIGFYYSDGWGQIGYFMFGIFALCFSALSAVVCIICRIIRRAKN